MGSILAKNGTAPLAALAVGVTTHLGFFIRNEHHLHGLTYMKVFSLLFIAAIVIIIRVDNEAFGSALARTGVLAASYLGGLYTSLLVYRVFFHPLRKFPGPLGNKIGNLWFSAQLGNADAHMKVLNLHKKYGNFVRIGSSDLSTIHPKATNAIYGPGSKCTRAAVYNGDPTSSMISLRDRASHDRRRRIWSPAFSDKALRGYEQRIQVYDNQLILRVAESSGKPVNVSKLFNYYSFDTMGDLAFGKPFDMLRNEKEHWAIKLLNDGMEPMAFMLPAWLFGMLSRIPSLMKDYYRLVRFCCDQLDERIKTKVEIPDIMATLLEPFKGKAPTGDDLNMLQGDSRLVVVAGSDTTAATLTHIFYHLALDPDQVSKLRREIGSHIDFGDITHQKIQRLDHLNGLINETLRLHPPVPTAMARLTPPEGIVIGETHIPGNMTVWCPPYVMSRSEEAYVDPESFIPERWYSKPEMVKEKTAFAPFSAGTYGCIGKPLALMQLRAIVAKLIMKFDVTFAPGEDGTGLIEKSRDRFSLEPADLNLVFDERQL